uniref:Gustatory receptor n=1 Tax=Rhodnius prolixus TaxID=13249 RepID=T1H7T8_RHOPR
MTSNVLRSLRSLFRLSRYLGIFPFSIDENGSVKFSMLSFVFAIFLQLFLFLFSMGYALFRLVIYQKINFIHEVLIQLGQFATQAAQFVHIITLSINSKRLDETFKMLILFENVDQPINTHECFWYPTLCCFLLIGAPIMESAAEIFIVADAVEFILIMWKWELAFCAIFQFTGLLSICRNCFKALNNNLNNRVEGYSKWEALEKSEQLIKCCETINKCYGPMLLIMLISFFGLITTNLYVAYLQWLNKWIVFIGVLSATILFCTFYYLVNACATTAKMANQFNRDVHKSLLHDILNECLTNGSLAVEAINRKELVFTACDYFVINYSFMCSMIETSATYLLICVEFDDDEEETQVYDQSINNSTEYYDNVTTEFLNKTFFT